MLACFPGHDRPVGLFLPLKSRFGSGDALRGRLRQVPGAALRRARGGGVPPLPQRRRAPARRGAALPDAQGPRRGRGTVKEGKRSSSIARMNQFSNSGNFAAILKEKMHFSAESHQTPRFCESGRSELDDV